ncbi:MAG: transcription termination/antitermination protein NusG [Candidatus Omnitrophica bacterium]|nr:transcription termination/antitermination protein NusG [Candidatus Omnitrophota bacterium]
MEWYIVQTQTGQEYKVKQLLESAIEQSKLSEYIKEVFVPTEKVTEVKSGKKKVSERKFYPGYLLVQMDLNDDTWLLIRKTPGVIRFLSSGDKPVPLNEEDVFKIRQQSEERIEQPRPKVVFEKGETVRVVEGPFTNFNGKVEEVSLEKGKVKALLTIFGRQTPVELEFWQVERM